MKFGFGLLLELLIIFLFFFNFASAQPIGGIDQIYLINLDHRTDRLASSLSKLTPLGIIPKRFSAVYGKNISYEILSDIALPCTPEMAMQRWMTTPFEDGTLGFILLSKNSPPRPVFSEWMTVGAVGCAMSHISILKEAFDYNYETIWVLEDDFLVHKDPHVFSELIEKLDRITGGNWDILYTDSDDVPLNTDLSKKLWWMWRPDLSPNGDLKYSYREKISNDFIRIGSRARTHSMIIRRSGIEKLLDHFQKNHLFLPIDHEIAFASGINLYMLSYPVVTHNPQADTDIQKPEPLHIAQQNTHWESYKQEVLGNCTSFLGWCTKEKAHCLMNFIFKHQPLICVEIGAFGGSTTYPLASALKFLGKGHLYAIDAWSNLEAVAGLSYEDPNYSWWEKVDFNSVRKSFFKGLSNQNLIPWCTVIHDTSKRASLAFSEDSIDMLYIDGNFSASGSLEDLADYFSKVKPNGYIWLNDANSFAKQASIAFLMERATFIPDESLRNSCVVFQKISSGQ